LALAWAVAYITGKLQNVAKCDNFYTIIIDGEFGYFAGIERL
jgi:hypothetical protein